MSDSHSNDTSALPPPIPQSPPLSVITATDQSGVVIIGAALALVFATISMVIRAYIRLQFGHKISMDDITSVLAMVSSFRQPRASRTRV